jgi:hypothetical protein
MTEQPGITSEELRAIAVELEENVLPIVANYSTIPIPLTVGNARYFPRPSREAQAAGQGFAVLQESITQAVETLYALALALDNDLEVPPVLFQLVQPYIEAYRRSTLSKLGKVADGNEQNAQNGDAQK